MKIDVLTLIENALIGGRNGEMAYIYNNPLIEQIYRDWRNNKQTENTFKDFLVECLKEDKDKSKVETPVVVTYKNLTKEYNINHSDKDYTEWKKLETEINVKRNQQRDLVQAMAKKCNESLADISVVKVQDTFRDKKIVFEFSVGAILEDKQN